MKRFLSLMLSVMLILTAFGTLTISVSANGNITLATELPVTTEHVLKAGEKIAFTVTYSDGGELEFYNNGTKTTAEVISTVSDESTTKTVTAAVTLNTGKNAIYATCGSDTSNTVTVYAVEYMNKQAYKTQNDLLTENNSKKAAESVTATSETIGEKTAVKTTSTNRFFDRENLGSAANVQILEIAYNVYFPNYPSGDMRLVGMYHIDDSGAEVQSLHNTFRIDSNGKLIYDMVNNGMQANAVKNDAFTFDLNKWYNVKQYYNKMTDAVDLYIDDCLVAKNIAVLKTADGTTQKSSFAGAKCLWIGSNLFYTADFEVNGYSALNMDVITPGDAFPVGSKVGVNVSGLSDGMNVGYVKNGVYTRLGTTDGVYGVEVQEGWNTIEIKVTDADGNNVKGLDGQPVSTTTKTYFGYGADQTATYEKVVKTDDNFSGTSTYPVTKAAAPASTEAYYSEKLVAYNSYYNNGANDDENGNPAPSLKLYVDGNIMGYNELQSDDTTTKAVTINPWENRAGMTVDTTDNIRYFNGRSEFSIDLKFADTISQMADASAAVVRIYRTVNGTRTQIPLLSLRKADETLFVPVCAYNNNTVVDSIDLIADPTEWHNYKFVLEPTLNKMFVYVDGILQADTVITSDNGDKITKIEEFRFNPPRCYFQPNQNKTMTLWADNVKAEYFTQPFKTEKEFASIDITPASGDLPAGTKARVTVKNMQEAQSLAIYQNGVKLTDDDIDGENGVYYVEIPSSYSTLSAAVLNTDGSKAEDESGNVIETSTFTYYGLSVPEDAETNIEVNDNFEANAEKPASMPSENDNDKYPEGYYAKRIELIGKNVQEKTEGGNPGAYVYYVHARDDMMYNTIDTSNTGNDGKYTWTGNQACQNSFPITAGGRKTDFNGVIAYSVDVKFDNNYDQGADNISSFIEFALTPTNGTRAFVHPLGVNKSGVFVTTVYKNNMSVSTEHPEFDVTEWHNYGMVIEPATNRFWITVDEVIVDSGNLYTGESIKDVETLKVYCPRTNVAGKKVSLSVDNILYATSSKGYETAATTEAFVNISANGVGVVPANIASDNKVADMAIIAKAADGTVELYPFDASAATGYTYFSFAKPAAKVFVWKWGTLKPLYSPILGSAE